jgi:hypothetical protein
MPHDPRVGRKTPVAPQSSLRVAFRSSYSVSALTFIEALPRACQIIA